MPDASRAGEPNPFAPFAPSRDQNDLTRSREAAKRNQNHRHADASHTGEPNPFAPFAPSRDQK
jgi:hypothetical protein